VQDFGDLFAFLGHGDGTFDPAVETRAVAWSAVMTSDFNGDGVLDLAAEDRILLGDGNGDFSRSVWYQTAPDGTPIRSPLTRWPLAAGDFTGDGFTDVAVALEDQNFILVYPGEGDGSLLSPVRQLIGWGGQAPATKTDFDGDGRLDIVVANSRSNTVTLLLSREEGTVLPRAVSAASETAVLAPGALARLSTTVPVALSFSAHPPWPTQLEGISLEVHDSSGAIHLAPLLMVSPGELTFQVPDAVALGEAKLSIVVENGSVDAGSMQVNSVAPAVFMQSHPRSIPAATAMLTKPGGFRVGVPVFRCDPPSYGGGCWPSGLPVPVYDDEGVYVTFYGTGFRGANEDNVTCSIGGFAVPVVYAGPQATPGVDQINIRLTPDLLFGNGIVTLRLDGVAANPVELGLTLPSTEDPPGQAHISLPADISGRLVGADYIIRVPSNWNGTLLIFAHGTQQQPGIAEVAPIAWPAANPSVEDQLLALGYALAGSGFRNSPKDGIYGTHALTIFFKYRVGNPARTIVWGNSLGGLIALKLVEEIPEIYDGAIAIGATDAGRPENMDAALAFGLAYDAAFGWPEANWGPLEDVRDDLVFGTDVYPLVPWPPAGPANYSLWEFIRLIMRLEPNAFWGKDPQTNSSSLGLGVWKATAQRASAEAEAGGPIAENVGFDYTLTSDEKSYLLSLGLDPEPLLAKMNARTNITARPSARNDAEHWAGLTGRLRRPVLTMHAIYDGLSAVYNESAYAAAVAESGATENLVQAYVDTVGHVSFDATQYLSVVDAMDQWLTTGVRPDAGSLPPAQGFDLSYVPIPWPF
jgi:uncharacterized protein (TIGR03437 family)